MLLQDDDASSDTRGRESAPCDLRPEEANAHAKRGGRLAVRLPDGTALTARFSRRLALLQKSYAVGDRVQIGMFADRRGDGLVLARDARGTLARWILTAPARPAS